MKTETAENPVHTAYRRFLAADDAWMVEIRRAIPGRAGDARYTAAAHGVEGSPLRAAYDEFVAAGDAWQAMAMAVA